MSNPLILQRKAEYALGWYYRNRERVCAERRARHAANPEVRAACDALYRSSRPYSALTEEQKERKRASARAYQARNRDKVLAKKKEYYKTDAGKACKKREAAVFVASGGRAKSEARRAAAGVSEARKASRKVYEAKKRSLEVNLSEFDVFVLQEAYKLSRLRKQVLGTSWDVDHIVPISLGGSSCSDNIQVVPALWNKQKSNKHQNHFWCV